MNYEFELEHFKAFAGTGPIPLRPITLIYGPNSSGKSSILQALLLLKQTLDESETPETLLLPKGNLVDLGGYREFIHRHEVERPFSIRLVESGPAKVFGRPDRLSPGLMIETNLLGLRITFNYNEGSANTTIGEFAFYMNDAAAPFCTFRRNPLSFKELSDTYNDPFLAVFDNSPNRVLMGAHAKEDHPAWIVWAKAEQKSVQQGKLPRLRESLDSIKSLLDVTEKAFQSMEESNSLIRSLIPSSETTPMNTIDLAPTRTLAAHTKQQIQHIEMPIESIARCLMERHQRTLLLTRNFLPSDNGFVINRNPPANDEQDTLAHTFDFDYRNDTRSGAKVYSQTTEMFRRFLNDLIYLGPLREFPERHYVYSGNVGGYVGTTGRFVPDLLFKDRRLLQHVNEVLAEFGIGYDILITGSPAGELNDVFSIRLVDRESQVSSSLRDVGFGISQVLPVIVQSMLSRNKTVCMEQPEIHLHPRLQAELGTLFAKCIGKPFQNRFIIETHSHHLMLRIQRLIRKGMLKSSDVSVIYVDKGESGSTCLELRLDEEGEFIDRWPNGFFEEGFEEMFST